jgi:glycosyltransferase involved in cell wall biosynthesis
LVPDATPPERMSILFLNPVGGRGWGGVERWLMDLAQGLAARGHRVSAAGRPGSAWMERSEAAGFRLCEVPLRGDFQLGQAWKLAKFMRRQGVDVVATKLHRGIRTSGFAAKFAGRPTVAAFMGLVETERGLRYRATYELFLDEVVTLTEKMRAEIVREGALDPGSVVAIPYGVRPQDYDVPESVGAEVRRALGVAPEAPVALAIGRLHLQKRFDLLFDAFALARKRLPGAVLLLAGHGRLLPTLEEQLARLALGDSVKLLGFRDDVPRVLSAADCLVMSSDFEGLPMVILEAMASSRPVVTTNVGSIEDEVDDGVTGRLVGKGDAAALAAALVDVLSSPDRGRAMGRAGRAKVEVRFPLARCVEETERRLLAVRRKRR